MNLQTLLDDYETDDQPIIEVLQDPKILKEFLDYLINWTQVQHPKYPFIVSEMIYSSYDALLSLFFTVLIDDKQAIVYLLSFLDKEQNDTSCGYFEKSLRPFLLLKCAETKQHIDLPKFIKLIHFEAIQNILIAILQCGHFEDEYKFNLLNLLILNLDDQSTRVLMAEQGILKTWVTTFPNQASKIFEAPLSLNQLYLVEQLGKWDIWNKDWLEKAIVQLKCALQQEQQLQQIDKQGECCNFLHTVPHLGELNLQMVKILSNTIANENTKEFQWILLHLLLQHEWNNQLQIYAYNMYKQMSRTNTPHYQYFSSIIPDFLVNNVSLEKQSLKLKNDVSHGYQWIFTQIIKMFELQESERFNQIKQHEDNFLLDWDPSNQKGRASFSLMDRLSERMNFWCKRKSEDGKTEEEPESEEVFQGRNSFGIKDAKLMEEELLMKQKQEELEELEGQKLQIIEEPQEQIIQKQLQQIFDAQKKYQQETETNSNVKELQDTIQDIKIENSEETVKSNDQNQNEQADLQENQEKQEKQEKQVDDNDEQQIVRGRQSCQFSAYQKD